MTLWCSWRGRVALLLFGSPLLWPSELSWKQTFKTLAVSATTNIVSLESVQWSREGLSILVDTGRHAVTSSLTREGRGTCQHPALQKWEAHPQENSFYLMGVRGNYCIENEELLTCSKHSFKEMAHNLKTAVWPCDFSFLLLERAYFKAMPFRSQAKPNKRWQGGRLEAVLSQKGGTVPFNSPLLSTPYETLECTPVEDIVPTLEVHRRGRCSFGHLWAVCKHRPR